MGMFDHITVEPQQHCRKCGAELHGWQSKDGPCQLDTLHFTMVNRFYAACDNCNEWHEYQRKVPTSSLDCYDLLPSRDQDEPAPQQK